MFAKLPKLRRIFATPSLANRRMGAVMVLLLPYLLDHRIPDRDLLRLLRAGLALEDREMWEWRRTDWVRVKDDDFAPLAHSLLDQLSASVVAAVSGRKLRR